MVGGDATIREMKMRQGKSGGICTRSHECG